MKKTKKPKNIKIIQDLVKKRTILLFSAFAIMALFSNKPLWIASALIGGIFSYFSFQHLINSQIKILQTRNKTLSLPLFFIRLLTYAAPLIIYFKYSNYLNLSIILIFLFSSQFIWIGTELQIRLKKRNT